MAPYIYQRYFETDLRFHEAFDSLNDPLNNMTIKTAGGDNPFSAFTVIVFTPGKTTWDRILSCLIETGYAQDASNQLVIPSHVLRMGLDYENDLLMCLVRVYGANEEEGFDNYLDNIGSELSVLRVLPNPPTLVNQLQPLSMQELRIRGAGKTEKELMPMMEKLKQSILEMVEKQLGWRATIYTTYNGSEKDEDGKEKEPSHPLADPTIHVPTAIDTRGIQRFKPMFVVFRNYLETETMSGPIPQEMISPIVIKFSKPAWPTVEPF